MTRRLSISFWAILGHLALIVVTSDCYVVDPRNTHLRNRGKSNQILSASKSNGESNVSSKKKIKPKKCPPNTRCPDYPSFALNDSRTKRVSFDDKRERRSNANDSGSPSSTKERLYDALAPSSPLEFDFLVSGVRDSNRRTRLLNRRSYTAREPFEQKYINEPPCLNDLKPPPSPYYESLWISIPFRVFTFALPYFLFPYLILFLDDYVTMEPEKLADITSKFGPGVSILYGTFISLTLSILYERQRDIQNDAAVEASLLALITRNLQSIFRRDEDLSVQAGQACADQIRTLAKGSRGSELLAIMYSDPYARMLEIIEDREYDLMDENNGELGGSGSALSSCRDILEQLFTLRADRLSDESLALPPTHFFIMSLLTGFILLGYTINVLPTVDLATGKPSNESALIFGLLTTVYVIFYNFAEDLNNPFSGLYQIRRSSTAAHLLQAKWLLVNNPRTKGKIDFDEPENVEDVLIRTPGIGDMVFARDEIFPDDNTQIDEK
eukprot:CAMPEP_0116123984 /NCGR_PEP_ID=MMETSP0329-20121206/5042_1 /TAXON_ID=697910 /ORGANISM="Pseudo-nitzschia arenysensis, Strain B593" /LENGTH=497 /DNA_ID=CAMNT_0003617941 /DNA_START=66 /DNA_END=1559 /DNA_ORIENTATION=-